MTNNKKERLSLSVHQLVDFLLREGDIDNRIYNQETMQLGSKLHSAYQKSQENTYLSEVFLKDEIESGDYIVSIEGRADGIIIGDENPVIDEIKTTVSPLEEFYEIQKEWHYGQAKCYAYMYIKKEGLPRCNIRLTYISQQDFDCKLIKEKCFTYEQLEKYVHDLVERYISFIQREKQHYIDRNKSIENLPFPYETFRKGQREVAKYVYTVSKKGGIFFFEAPTGIGKTISALFPALKSLAKTNNAKIFYLTAKTSGRQSCYDAMTACYENGLIGRDSLLVAKEKMCFSPGKSCNPDECPFTKNYYSKLREIIEKESKEHNRYNQETVSKIAEEYEVCPFELQLDLSLLSDVITCDYNYFFDPLVKLERYFSEEVDSSKYVILIDEAHNLNTRTRDMFSETISLKEVNKAYDDLAGSPFKKVRNSLKNLMKRLKVLENEGKDFKVYEKIDETVDKYLNRFDESTKNKEKEELERSMPFPKSVKDLSRKVYRFLFLMSNYSQNSTLYTFLDHGDFKLEFQCLDPSPYLISDFNKVKGVTLFSATLSPIDYYMESLLNDTSYPFLSLPSPFPRENFHLMVASNISIRYKNREKTYEKVASYLEAFVQGKVGNYFIYFPSYEYLEKIQGMLNFNDADVYIQNREMDDIDKEKFLKHFKKEPSKTTIGLLIIGGSFSEGIDLPDDRLIGVAVVGVGLAQISKDIDLIKEYYDNKNGEGFKYAYINPGMNKIMQAVGRLIRSEKDVGSALLIDERYSNSDYKPLFSKNWSHYEIVNSKEDIIKSLSSFYRKVGK